MNTNLESAVVIDESPVIEPTEKVTLGEFKIVLADKRTVKSSCSGQMIEALKRAKTPLGLNALAARVRLTKKGQALKVKDVKARVATCAKWYEKNTDFVATDEKGFYYLTRQSI